MPTVAEPFDRDLVPGAERCLMPGAAPAEAAEISVEEELWLALLAAQLQRVVTDVPGHRDFLRGVRGKKVATLTDAQRKQVMRLAWRYRFQLPTMLRPGADPDQPYPIQR